MERQNITLSIPKDTLKKAKHIAINKDKSLSALLTDTIEEIVHREEGYQNAREQQLLLMEKGLDYGLQGKPTWSREEIYERKES